jgi:hypothetical protein
VKRLLVLAFVAGGAFFADRYAVVEAFVRAGRRFLEAWGREDTPAAVAMTEGEAARKTVEARILRGVCEVPVEALRGSRSSLESRTADPGGDAVLTMRQVVGFDPPGMTTGVGGAMAASFRHVVTMRKTPGGWRVVGFEPKFLDAVPTRAR